MFGTRATFAVSNMTQLQFGDSQPDDHIVFSSSPANHHPAQCCETWERLSSVNPPPQRQQSWMLGTPVFSHRLTREANGFQLRRKINLQGGQNIWLRDPRRWAGHDHRLIKSQLVFDSCFNLFLVIQGLQILWSGNIRIRAGERNLGFCLHELTKCQKMEIFTIKHLSRLKLKHFCDSFSQSGEPLPSF